MKMKIIAITLFALLNFILVSSAEADESVQNEQYEASVFFEVDAYIAREMKRQRLPGLVSGL